MFIARKPEVIEVDGWRILGQSFCRPENEGRVPVVFLGGAFQSYRSFRRETAALVEDRPILLVDLPGQGLNSQRAASLSFDDLADLLAAVLDRRGVDRVVPVGLSYGSGIAYTFAARHPGRVEKVVLGGITSRVRPMLRALLEHGFELLARGELDAFAEGIAAHLFNPAAVAETGVTEEQFDLLKSSIVALDDEDLQRYADNTRRLLASRLGPAPRCDVLVISARHDAFILPHEAMDVARACPRGRFVLFERADHLVPFERHDDLLALYRRFLRDEPLEAAGLTILDPTLPELLERRLSPRWQVDLPAVLEHRSGAWTSGRLANLSDDGALVTTGAPLAVTDVTTLRVPAAGIVIPVAAVPDDRGTRCTFFRTSRAGAEAVRRLVAAVRDQAVALEWHDDGATTRP